MQKWLIVVAFKILRIVLDRKARNQRQARTLKQPFLLKQPTYITCILFQERINLSVINQFQSSIWFIKTIQLLSMTELYEYKTTPFSGLPFKNIFHSSDCLGKMDSNSNPRPYGEKYCLHDKLVKITQFMMPFIADLTKNWPASLMIEALAVVLSSKINQIDKS